MKMNSTLSHHLVHSHVNFISTYCTILIILLGLVHIQASAQTDLSPNGIRVKNNASQTLIHDEGRSTYTFLYEDGHHKIEHIIYLRESSVRRGLVTVRTTFDERYRSIPIDEGGFIIRSGSDTIMPVQAIASNRSQLVSEEIINNNKIVFRYEEEWEGVPLKKSYTFSLEGKSLKIHAVAHNPRSATTYFTGFDLGPSKYMSNPQIYQLPSNPFLFFSDRQEYYHSVFIDPTQSSFNRYEWTNEVVHQTAIKANNSPAWIDVKEGEVIPDIECVIYCTSSEDYLDTIPSPTLANQRIANINKPIIEISPRATAPWPYLPNRMVRRWVAPHSGLVKLKGSFLSNSPNQSIIEVELKQAEGKQIHTLFNQALNNKTKPTTGINGEFLVQELDELIFYFDNSAVLEGGEIDSRINITLGNKVFDSIEDFSPQQGHKGWYYDQAIGETLTPLVWNQTKHRWESAYDHSWQNYKTLAPLAAARENPVHQTQQFIDELKSLGIKDSIWFLTGWDQVQDKYPQDYRDLVDRISNQGDQVIYQLSSKTILDEWNQVKQEQTELTLANSIEKFGSVLRSINQRFTREGVMVNPTALITPFREMQNLSLIDNTQERSERRLYSYLNTALNIITDRGQRPLYLQTGNSQQRLSLVLAEQAHGMIPPYYPEAPAVSIVDEDLYQGRKSNRIGFGLTPETETIDPRFYPADSAMTAMLSYGRTPYINGNIWSSNLTAREIRKWLLSQYALLAPVYEDYADPNIKVLEAGYANDTIDSATISKHIMLRKKFDDYDRLVIRYENGLNIWANRGGEAWQLDPSQVPNAKISPNGFFAFNPYSHMKSFVGTIAEMRVQLVDSQDAMFLHSVNNQFIQYGDYITDGMLYMWKSPYLDRPNFSILDLTEVTHASNLNPIMRLNGKMDLSLTWQDPQTALVQVLQADKPGSMIDLFILPTSWLDENQYHVKVSKNGKPLVDNMVSTIQSSGEIGLRLANLHTGDRLLLQHSPKVIDTP